MAHPALTVEVLRGREIESAHLVDAVIVDADGGVVDGWGDVDRLVMPRSAAKPIQQLPLINSGAAAAFELDHTELALACASHNGEEAHVDRVLSWLNRLGLSADDLECGEQPPIHQPALIEMVALGQRPGREHNNCSGKHAGFLSVCRHLDLPTNAYISPQHQLQVEHVSPSLSEMCGVDLHGQQPGIDGCGIPVWQIPMKNLATGWARLIDSPAGVKLLEAMMAEPFYVAGTDRSSTTMMNNRTRPVAVKGGAEGVYCGAVMDDRFGIALKVRDGAGRAAEVAMQHILADLKAVERSSHRLSNWAGTEVGIIRVKV